MRDQWTRIGAAWSHGDGKGFNIKLNGRLVIRERADDAQADDAGADEAHAATAQ